VSFFPHVLTVWQSGRPGRPDAQLEGTLNNETDISPIAKCHYVVVFEIDSYSDAAQYKHKTKPRNPGWTVDRDPDRAVVIHFHFLAPKCDIRNKGKRIQIAGKIAL
jgi:hypothetical protein